MTMRKMLISRAQIDQISVTDATTPLNEAFAAFWAYPEWSNCCQPESGGAQANGVRYWAKRDSFPVSTPLIQCLHLTA